MNLSKSKYTNACTCKKMLWLDTNKKEVKGDIDPTSAMDNGNMVHSIARDLLGSHVTIEFNNDLKKMVEETEKELQKEKNVICEASFIYQNNFCSVDILEKNIDEYNIYEVKGSTSIKDIYLTDISYQYYVLKKLGLNIKHYYLVYINNKYTRVGKLDLNKLFIKKDLLNDIISLQDEVEKNIIEINNYMKNKIEPKEPLDLKCFKPYKCPFFDYCTKDLEKPNIFDINSLNKKTMLKFYKNNIISFKELLKSNLDNKYKMQVDYELNNKCDYINKENIKEFLNTLSLPLYFLDFETYQLPIPKYDNTFPYMQIPFQYSLHYLDKNNKLYHKEFLGTKNDPRRELADSLVKDIPKDMCVLAYNMQFEKMVIKKLAETYPDLKDHLMNIYNNMKDLMIPFKNKDYYSKLMQGSYSIKYVLPALFPDDKELDYHSLDLIHNGSEAMSYYDTLFDKSKEEQAYIRENLLKYCFLDTYAMVKIYEKLLDVTEKNTKDKILCK